MSISQLLRDSAEDRQGTSLSHRMRSRRFELFERATRHLPRPLSVLDVGGTAAYWEQRGWADRPDVTITLVNIQPEPRQHENVIPTVGDACDLGQHEDAAFGLVFSNSVIEHLFTWDRQRAMAREVRRVGRAYWVQTPNYWFPVEPHFLTPGWQYLPVDARVWILQHHQVGWRGQCPDRQVAERYVREVRLLRRRELADLFPDGSLVPERVGSLVKSWTAVRL